MNLSRVLNPPKTGLNEFKSWNIEYNFKWNQQYLSRGSNSLNSASESKFHEFESCLKSAENRFHLNAGSNLKTLYTNLNVTHYIWAAA